MKYISDTFEDLHANLKTGKGDYENADPEDRDEYSAKNTFFVPPLPPVGHIYVLEQNYLK